MYYQKANINFKKAALVTSPEEACKRGDIKFYREVMLEIGPFPGEVMLEIRPFARNTEIQMTTLV